MSIAAHVAILGGTGYGAGELLRLLTQHPHLRVTSVVSHSQGGVAVPDVHPHLQGFYDGLSYDGNLDLPALLDAPRSAVFVALPHGASSAAIEGVVRGAVERGAQERLAVIDLSADFRLEDEAEHQAVYPETPFAEDRRRAFTYGLPEFFRERIVGGARMIANPGCLATAAILASAPLAKLGAAFLAIDATTGSSGSGAALKETTHHPTRHADYRAYAPLAHRHEPEIRQALRRIAGTAPVTSFVPHSMDVTRGIFVTVHATLADAIEPAALQAHYEETYAGCPFVRLVGGTPTLQSVVGSNFCDVAVVARGRQVAAFAALDNLVKGMAGAAIQNLNLILGLDERTGLWAPALRPL